MIYLGAQAGWVWLPGIFVTRVAAPVLTLTTEMADLPPRVELQAMKEPSGDHVGLSLLPSLVNCRGPPP